MELAALFGRTPDLAHQELRAVAPILPFQWSIDSIPGIATLLKPVEGRYGHDFLINNFHDEVFHDTVMKLQRRLGGTVRLAWGEWCTFEELPQKSHDIVTKLLAPKSGKWTVGASVWGKGIIPHRFALNLKKKLQAEGKSVRTLTAQTGLQLNSAQVLHNKLAYLSYGSGVELILIQRGQQWWCGVTLTSQDISDYTNRDFGIPRPDPVSGMLPPKLAQAMINLAVGTEKASVYDPFCGNGRIVMEAALMGLDAYGSDIAPTKVTAAQENMGWLEHEYGVLAHVERVWEADATQSPARKISPPWYVVAEPYLGPPLRQPLPINHKQEWLAELERLYHDFFMTWSSVMTADRPRSFLMIFPRAKTFGGGEVSVYEALVDRLNKMGYSSKVLFCYDRPDSLVRRDLVQLMYSK